MKGVFFLSFPALCAHLVSAQTLIADNLPACAKQCDILTQAQSSCVPSGGAPVSDQGTYQSCFCQSALLQQLRGSQAVQLCSQCSQSDMGSIQNWYKGLCSGGAAQVANSQPNNQPTTTALATTAPSTPNSATTPTQQGTTVNSQDANESKPAPEGPWMKTHYKWIIMLIVLFIGLGLLAWAFWFFHRRYHRRREAQWSQATGSRPDITTWGPGQSVHDLSYTPGGSVNVEKGKAREQVRGVNEPPPARMRENRLSKF